MMKLFSIVFMAVSLLLVNSGRASEIICDETELSAQIIEHRNAFNEAIRTADLVKIESLLSSDNILITGSNSDLYGSKQAHLDVWRKNFASTEERIMYVRTPACVSVSKLGYMALEYGNWNGQKDSNALFSGSYTAKWRLNIELQKWFLEAEVYMTSYKYGQN